jgi:hypothetical protein
MTSRDGLATARINRTAIRALFACPIGAVLLALFGCASISARGENETDTRVIDLKIGANPIGWLDNETIVVIGDTGERYARKDGASETVLRVLTINYKTAEQRVLGKAGSQVCYVDGYISSVYLDRGTDELWAIYGKIGDETVQKIRPGEFTFDRGPGGSCRPKRPPSTRPAWLKQNTRFWQLWPATGHINCRAASANVRDRHVKARFHAPDDNVGIELPFSCYHVFRGLRYYPFKGAYFALEFDFRAPWPEGRDRRAFWLYPDGRVEIIALPYSTAIRENGVPTVRGIVAFARPVNRDDDYWVYLVTPESAKRVIRGNASGVTSPDGCKVAMLHEPEFGARVKGQPVNNPGTLKVLELCNGK